MGRPRTFEKAKTLAAATSTFLEKGFSGTSYEDLTNATGLGRASLYNTFGDKSALFVECLNYFSGREIDSAIEILNSESLPPREALRSALTTLVGVSDPAKRKEGCLFINTVFDPTALSNKSIETAVKSILLPFQKSFSQLMKRDAKKRKLKEPAERDTTEFLMMCLGGLRWYAKINHSLPELMRRIEEVTDAAFYLARKGESEK